MHLDDLEHSQIILLSILLTLVISVATSVSVLSILESRHGDTTVVSKTINRIIERKISTDPTITKEAIEKDIETLITSISDGNKQIEINIGNNLAKRFVSSQFNTEIFNQPVIILENQKTLFVEKNHNRQSSDLEIVLEENTYNFSELTDSRVKNYSIYVLDDATDVFPVSSDITISNQSDIKIGKRVHLLNNRNDDLYYIEGVISSIQKDENEIVSFSISINKDNSNTDLFVFDSNSKLLGILFKNDENAVTPVYKSIFLYNNKKEQI